MTALGSFLISLGFRAVANNEFELETCPWCGGRKTLRFNVVKLIGVCYKCPQTVFLRMLAQDIAGINMSEMKQYVEDHNADERLKSGFADAMLEGLLGEDHARGLPRMHEVQLPSEFRLLKDGVGSVIGKRAIKYMTGRGFDLDTLFDMQFGYCASGEYEGRIIIPFYENGMLVYWQARDFTGLVDPRDKIKNPWASATQHGKSDVLFNYDGIKDKDVIIMTESWGSSLATGKMAFAINGKSLSDVQLQKIVQMPAHTVIVLLDAGTQVQSWSAAAKLHNSQKNVMVCELPTGDPADILHSVLLESVRGAKRYTAEDHIRAVARGKWN